MSINILHIVYAGYPSISGYTIRTEKILDQLSKSNLYKFDVAVSIFSNRKEQLKSGNYFVLENRNYYQLLTYKIFRILTWLYKIPKLRLIIKYFLIILNSYIIIRRLNISKYKVIHGHSTFLNGLSSWLIARLYNKKFIYDVHALGIDSYTKINSRYRFEKMLEGFLLKRADGIIAIDQPVKKHIKIEFKIEENKVFVAPNGIDTVVYSKRNKDYSMYQKLELPDEKILIGCDDSKSIEGFEFVLNNIDLIIDQIPNVHFVVFGSKKRIRGIEHFTFLPKIRHEEMVEYYNILDPFVMTRVKNKQTDTVTPLKILEIMSCEIPVIVSDVEGLTSCIIDNETGFILRKYDVKEFISKIIEVLKNNNKNRIAYNARKWVQENKTWQKTAEQYTNVYNYTYLRNEYII